MPWHYYIWGPLALAVLLGLSYEYNRRKNAADKKAGKSKRQELIEQFQAQDAARRAEAEKLANAPPAPPPPPNVKI